MAKDLDELKASLLEDFRELAKREKKERLRKEGERGLTEQDKWMFERIFERIERNDKIPLKDRVITVPRIKRTFDDSTATSQTGKPGLSKSIRKADDRQSKGSVTSSSNESSTLSGLHALLDKLTAKR